MSKSLLQIRIAANTPNETTIMERVKVMDTTEYDVLLGMQFSGACGGYVDPVTEHFCRRVDCHVTWRMPCMLVRLPVNCKALPQDSPLTANFVGEVTEAADLMEAQLGEEEFEGTLNLEEE